MHMKEQTKYYWNSCLMEIKNAWQKVTKMKIG